MTFGELYQYCIIINNSKITVEKYIACARPLSSDRNDIYVEILLKTKVIDKNQCHTIEYLRWNYIFIHNEDLLKNSYFTFNKL